MVNIQSGIVNRRVWTVLRQAAFAIGLVFAGVVGANREAQSAETDVAREQALIDRIGGTAGAGDFNGASCSVPGALNARLNRAPAWVRNVVEQLAPQFRLDPALVLAVIAVESNFQPGAQSHKQAQGMMQLIPATAERFGVQDPFDPQQNIRGGMQYLRWLLEYFNGDLSKALAGYNAGEGAVDRYKGIPPYRETKQYVEKVRALYGCPNATQPMPEITNDEIYLLRLLILSVLDTADDGSSVLESAATGASQTAAGGTVLDPLRPCRTTTPAAGLAALDNHQLESVGPGTVSSIGCP